MNFLLSFFLYFETDEYINKLISKQGAKNTLSELVDLSFVILGLAAVFAVVYAFKHYVKGEDGGSDSTFLKIAIGLAICAVLLFAIQTAFLSVGIDG